MNDLALVQVVYNVQYLARKVHHQRLVHHSGRRQAHLVVNVQQRAKWAKLAYQHTAVGRYNRRRNIHKAGQLQQ